MVNKASGIPDSLFLFDVIAARPPEPKVKIPQHPIWTENKAKLIERYLFYFVLITKHGTYIDGFAGPQQPRNPEMWAAKLVLEIQPRWLRNFYLFETNKRKIAKLLQLKNSQPLREKKEPKQQIDVRHGDFNSLILEVLESGKIKQKEATFCLLDQITFQCWWSTLVALSRYKTQGNKIELVYFFANAWLDRALAAQRDKYVLEKWWGRKDWPKLKDMSQTARVLLFVERLKKELGYWSVRPWPIYESEKGKRIMYYMIHATDHPAAPFAMQRAYAKAVGPMESPREVQLELGIL